MNEIVSREKLNTTISDSTTPRLQQVLSESFMRDFFQNYLPHNLEKRRSEISHCQIIGKRYSPGKWCIVTYALTFGSEGEQQKLFLQVHAGQEVECEPGRWHPDGVRLVPELRARLWQFPDDPELRSLPQLMDARWLQELFTHTSIDGVRKKNRSWLTIKPVKYVPLKRCLVLVRVGHLGHKNCTKLLGKLDTDAMGSSVLETMRQLWMTQSNRQTAFCVAAPIGYDDQNRILWQRWSPGESFIQFVQNNALTVACSRVAEGLADLHQTMLEGLPASSEGENLKKLQERVGHLMAFHHRLEAPLLRLLDRLEGSEPLHKPAAEVPIHGDFNYSQILFNDGKPIFTDFESARLGDPLYDVAHFVVALHSLDVQRWFNPHEVTQAVVRFCQTYKSRVPWEVSEQALRAQVAAALICRRAYKVLTRLEERALKKIEYYLNLAAQYLKEEEI